MGDVIIRTKIDEGVSITTPDGVPLHLAIVDGSGKVLASGGAVAHAVFKASMKAYDDFWQGSGHMTTITPAGLLPE